MFDAWKQRQRQRLENRPERTVFYNIFATMMLVLAVELLMSAASILAINVTGQLDENAKDLLTMRVRNRASYVQEILRNAEDLEQLSDQITATTQQLLKSGDISLDTLDNSSEQSDALLVALAPQLLDTLRTKQVTGIFLILNTHDLDTCEVGKKMPGIYLRDMDPDARPSERNSDLLLERASATVVKELAIGTDKGWQPAFPYQGDTKGGILRTVFQTAYKSDAGLSAESYGRWTTNSYCLAGDDRHAIAYSMPLILPDGTVYGVVGVELLTEYLQTKLPFTELDEDKAGTYFIVTTTDDALTDGVLSLRKTVTSGEDLVTADAPLGVLNCRSNGNGGNWVELNDKRYYMVLEPLQVYNRTLCRRKVVSGRYHGTVGAAGFFQPGARGAADHHSDHAGAERFGQPAGLGTAGQTHQPFVPRGDRRAGEKDLPPPVPHRHPGGGPLCRDHYRAEQGAGDQLHQVFAHHGYGQCGDRRLRAAHRHRQRVCDR